MTEKDRELALYCLKANSDYHSEVCEECVNYPNCDHTIQDDVTETIIKALEQEPCDDCVRRQDVLDILKDKWGMFSDANDAMQESIDTIRALKPATPQPKEIGHWFIDERPESDREVICSNCEQPVFKYHKMDFDYRPQYCPNCGTKMKGDKE